MLRRHSRSSAAASTGPATTTSCSPATAATTSALRRRYKTALAAAGLRPLRFPDLSHTFGTRMIAKADIRRVQEWMGHADIQTTMRYLHFAPRAEDAALVAEAFASPQPTDDTIVTG